MATIEEQLAKIPAELITAAGKHVHSLSQFDSVNRTKPAQLAELTVGQPVYVFAMGGFWRLGVVVKLTKVRATVAYTTPSSAGRVYLKASPIIRVGVHA